MNAAMPKTRPVRRRILELFLAVVLGVGVAHVLIIGYCCATNWYHGGSADPRCAASLMRGYAEVHELDFHPPRVSCRYEPQVGMGAP
jgi:hypothetical protein